MVLFIGAGSIFLQIGLQNFSGLWGLITPEKPFIPSDTITVMPCGGLVRLMI